MHFVARYNSNPKSVVNEGAIDEVGLIGTPRIGPISVIKIVKPLNIGTIYCGGPKRNNSQMGQVCMIFAALSFLG